MAILSVDELDTWLRTYERENRNGELVTVHRPEFPIKIYLRWLRTTDDPTTYEIKIDLAVTEFGDEILSRNAPAARQWIEENFSAYPDGLDNSRVRDLQQICEYVRDGRSGPVTIDITGGTLSRDAEEQIRVNGQYRTLIDATITTDDTLTITIEDALRATIDTTTLN